MKAANGKTYMKKNSLFVVFLIFTLLLTIALGLSLKSIQAQSERFKISGYILDSNGHGIAGTDVIFNVPSIVPGIFTDNSGYYETYGPSDTSHINVWSLYDSNYVNYDQPGFVVASDVTKNITLYTGCKVSDYISDYSGTPMTGAAVLLNNYGSGWFSNANGYYFLNVPAGTYTINAHPRTGYNYPGPTSNFPTYYEYNFIVSGNTIKNITVGSPTATPTSTPTSSPTPMPTLPPNLTPAPTGAPAPTQQPTMSPTPSQTHPATPIPAFALLPATVQPNENSPPNLALLLLIVAGFVIAIIWLVRIFDISQFDVGILKYKQSLTKCKKVKAQVCLKNHFENLISCEQCPLSVSSGENSNDDS